MKEKRGQSMSTNTIILLVLGLIILVVLALGFIIGWDKFLPFLFTSNNVETITSQCQAACVNSNTYGFCSEARTLKATDLPEGGKEKKANCTFFAKTGTYTKYGISDCPGLCPAPTQISP